MATAPLKSKAACYLAGTHGRRAVNHCTALLFTHARHKKWPFFFFGFFF